MCNRKGATVMSKHLDKTDRGEDEHMGAHTSVSDGLPDLVPAVDLSDRADVFGPSRVQKSRYFFHVLTDLPMNSGCDTIILESNIY